MEFLLHKKFGRAIFFSYREFSLTRSSLIGSFDCTSILRVACFSVPRAERCLPSFFFLLYRSTSSFFISVGIKQGDGALFIGLECFNMLSEVFYFRT